MIIYVYDHVRTTYNALFALLVQFKEYGCFVDTKHCAYCMPYVDDSNINSIENISHPHVSM